MEAADLILAYVPNAEWMSFAEALELARERDTEAAAQLEADARTLRRMEAAKKAASEPEPDSTEPPESIRGLLHALGYR